MFFEAAEAASKKPEHDRSSAIHVPVFLAFYVVLCYAVPGAISTPVGGSPHLGVKHFFAPFTYRKGVVRMVTWPALIEFCSFLVALISLIIGIIDHNDKK